MIDKSSSKAGGDGCDCDREPELMRRMAMTLDSDQFLQGVERKLAEVNLRTDVRERRVGRATEYASQRAAAEIVHA